MKKVVLTFVLLISVTSIYAQQSLEGVWNTGKENTMVEVYPKDGSWYGKVISSDNSKVKVGTEILKDFKKEGELWKGKLYSIKKAKWYSSTVKPAENELLIKIFAGFITKEIKWTKEK